MAEGGDGRYVATRPIKNAAKGREGELLDKIGINWRAGHPHILCPYPQHDDSNASWRWLEPAARALCSCITKPDSIFDVISKVESIDFEQAKVRVAELLGLTDLIKVKTEGGGQKTDAASLLAPPSVLRDDSLPQRYLGGRTDLDPDLIPRPSTAIAGWTELAYYEASGRKGGRPKKIASPPCAVFGTLAADGRQHAHRIYLNATGDGKANLGLGPSGKSRDVKKSAKKADDLLSISGCCVIWGNPDVATAILTEGIENAAPPAVVFEEEIDRNEFTVQSAIDANGLENWKPYPHTKTIIIGADRDEAKQGAGFKRGEQAARKLAFRLIYVEKLDIEVRLALPGKVGTNTDLRDFFCAAGPGAVRALILAAEPIIPTQAEINDYEAKIAAKSEIEWLNEALPLPPLLDLRLEYRTAEDGRVWLHKFYGVIEDDDTGEIQEVWKPICSPIGNLLLLSSTGPQLIYGLRIHVRNFAGEINTLDFLRGELPKVNAAGIRSELLAGGVRVVNGGEDTIVELLKQAEPQNAVHVGGATGWQDDDFLTFEGRS